MEAVKEGKRAATAADESGWDGGQERTAKERMGQRELGKATQKTEKHQKTKPTCGKQEASAWACGES